MPQAERGDQLDFSRQVIGVIRCDPAQFREQPRRDSLRFGMLHAVHDAVTDGLDRRGDRLRLEPVQQKTHRRAVVSRGKVPKDLQFSRRIADDQIGAVQPDALDFSRELLARRFAGLIHRKPDARGSAVDRQDTRRSRLHRSGFGRHTST